MSESLSNPFTTYNSKGEVRTLVGNWQEEQVLKHATGTSRSKTAAQLQQAVQNTGLDAGVFAARQDAAANEPTHSRVIEHTEQLLPKEWLTHNTVNFQPPAARTYDLASYPNTKQHGPRQEQELKPMLQAAAEEAPGTLSIPSFETTNGATFQPHDLDGLKVGARVMKTQEGVPSVRDPVFLAETKLMPKASVDRLMGCHHSSGNRRSCSSATFSSWIGDPAVPITLYTEAAAKSTYIGQFYAWSELDPTASHYIPAMELSTVIRELPPPMGVKGEGGEQAKLQSIIMSIDIPVRKKNQVHFLETLHALAGRVAGAPVPEGEEIRIHQEMYSRLPTPYIDTQNTPKYTVAHFYAALYVQAAVRGFLRRHKLRGAGAVSGFQSINLRALGLPEEQDAELDSHGRP